MMSPKTFRCISTVVLLSLFFSWNLTGNTPAKNNQGNSLFKLAPDDVPKSLEVVNAVYLKITPEALTNIYQQKSASLELQIPTGNNNKIDLQLTRKNFLTENFIVTQQTANGPELFEYQPGLYYQGTVVGEANSLVAISFFEDRIMAVLSYNGDDHNLGISVDATKAEDDVYIFYPESNLLIGNNFECHTADTQVDVPADNGTNTSGLTTTVNSVKMYMECDYLMFQDFGNDVTATTDFVTAMFNVVSAVYDIDDVCMELNEVFVWAVQDPYPTSSSNAALDAFESQLNGNFNGDLAHLLSTTNQGNGGLAYVDVLCYSQLGIGYSNIDDTYNNLPNFSWTVEVVTHEIGHNLGSPHTHSCSWSGGPIDNCFCPESSCSPGPEPGSIGGTIMSYCHLTGSPTYGDCDIPGFPNPGIDLNLGFGPQPSALVFSKVEGSSCLTACGGGGGGGGGGGSALNCTNAIELFSDITYNGNTDNGASNVSTYGCANYDEPGNEVVHFFTAPVSGEAIINYNENVAGYIDLFVLSSCNPNSCLLFFDGGMGISETMDVVAGQTYYFVTDVYVGGAGGAYDLTITFPDGACQCDNPNALSCDNLEAYNQGSLGPQTVCWTTFTGTQGGLEEGMVNDEQASSGSNSVKIEGGSNGGPQDVVFVPGNYTSGHYELSFKLYVPSGKSAYYNLQHIFEPATESYQWASEVYFNSNGTGSLNAGVENATTFSYTQGTWVDVVQNIDIDNDLTTLTIGGTAIYSWPFSSQANDVNGGTNALAGVNFYPVNDTYLYWIDDIELIEFSGTPAMSVSPANHDVNSSNGNVQFNVSANINWSVTDDATWLTLSPNGTNGNGSVDAIFTENPTSSPRVAILTVTGGGLTETVTVTQEGFVPPAMAVSPANHNVGASNGNVVFNVNANINWTVTDNANWMTLNPSGTNGNGMIDATFVANPTTNPRVATVTVTGGGITQIVTVSQEAAAVPISVTANVTSETCFGMMDGTIDLEIAGGVPNYTYVWNNGATSQDLNGLSPGSYICTITDSSGTISTTSTFTVVAAPQLIAQIEAPGTINCNQQNIVINATASTTGTGVSSSWATSGGNIVSGVNTLTPLVDEAGVYTLTLTYNNNPNCISTEEVTIVEVPELEASTSTTPSNGSASDGSAIVNASGGSIPYEYNWNTNPPQTTQLATGLTTGTYAVTVTDADGCILVVMATVDVLTGINDIDGLNRFDLFPNPSKGLVNLEIELETSKEVNVKIFDVLGTIVWNGRYDQHHVSQQVDLSDLSSAVYFVEMEVDGMSITRRLLIRK